jgi:uncharacterized protein GlcG (DUF336 family)
LNLPFDAAMLRGFVKQKTGFGNDSDSLNQSIILSENFVVNSLNLNHANQILQGAIQAARAANYKPMGIVVLDASGQLVAFAREDGASMFRFDIARGKAWGAVGMGSSSRALAERAKDNPNFFVALAATAEGKFLPQPGAVLIKDAAGHILGSAGASGGTGDEDELICMAGIQAAGLVAG